MQRLAAWLCVAVVLATSQVHADEVKTLTRFHDPVVVTASWLPQVLGHSTAEFALYRLRGGVLEPMPHQFDPRGQDAGIEVQVPRDFIVDGNDELVFMAKDTGERASASPDPAGSAGPTRTAEINPSAEVTPPADAAATADGTPAATADAATTAEGTRRAGEAGRIAVPIAAQLANAIEIEVEDPLDGGRGWAYLMAPPADDKPEPPPPYVRFDVARRRATSPLYEIEYADGHNFLTALQISPDAGGNGANLLRQTRMLGEPKFSLLLGDVSLKFTERNSIVQVDGVRVGPVRAVRRVALAIDLGPLFPDLPNGTVHTFHYFSSYTTPTKMSVPWLALKTLRDFRFENLFEFTPAETPRRYWDGANPAGLDFGAPLEQLVTDRDHDWWAVAGESGSLLQAFLVPQEWSEWGVRRGSVVGPTGAGFTLRDMIRLQRSGAYDMMQATVILPQGYHPGYETQVMAMFHAPLRVQVRRVEEIGKAANREIGVLPGSRTPTAGLPGVGEGGAHQSHDRRSRNAD